VICGKGFPPTVEGLYLPRFFFLKWSVLVHFDLLFLWFECSGWVCRAYQLHERDEYRRIGFGIFVKLAFRASLFAERCLGVCLLRDALNVLM